MTGKADREVTPDEIYVRIVINEKDNKGKVSVEQQEKEMFRRLKAAHIDIEKDLVVQDMSSDLQTYFLRKNAILSTKTYQLKSPAPRSSDKRSKLCRRQGSPT